MKSFSLYRFGKQNASPRTRSAPATPSPAQKFPPAEEPERSDAESARSALLADFFRRHESAARRTPGKNR